MEKKKLKLNIKTPQSTTTIGATGLLSQFYLTLQHIKIGEF